MHRQSAAPLLFMQPMRLSILATLIATVSSAAVAQTAAPGASAPRILPTKIDVPPPPAIGFAVAPIWNMSHIQDLRSLIKQAAVEGIDPKRYDDSALASLDSTSDSNALATIGRPIALKLARDFYQGTHAAKASMWKMRPETRDYDALVDQAVRDGDLVSAINSLLPTDKDYRQLRGAYTPCLTATASYCDTLRINLDRWRAMPRQRADRSIWVNVPAYTLQLIDKDAVTATHKVIVGKINSPTLQFTADATAVTFNPWWTIPSSIVRESVGSMVRNRPAVAAQRGYVVTKDANGRSIYRQRPGPGNSLGQMKIEMPNPYAIFLHDTPARTLFNNNTRAYSHGCVRVEYPLKLGLELLGPQMNEKAAQDLFTKRTNKTIRLEKPIPVFFVYFTAVPDPDHIGKIIYYPDIYKQDSQFKSASIPAYQETECSTTKSG